MGSSQLASLQATHVSVPKATVHNAAFGVLEVHGSAPCAGCDSCARPGVYSQAGSSNRRQENHKTAKVVSSLRRQMVTLIKATKVFFAARLACICHTKTTQVYLPACLPTSLHTYTACSKGLGVVYVYICFHRELVHSSL